MNYLFKKKLDSKGDVNLFQDKKNPKKNQTNRNKFIEFICECTIQKLTN